MPTSDFILLFNPIMPPFVPRKRPRNPSPVSDKPTPPTRLSESKKPTLFDSLDERPKTGRTLQDNQAYLNRLGDDSSGSSLDDISSSEFEDVDSVAPSKRRKVDHDDDGEDDVDWEDAVAMPSAAPSTSAPEPSGDLVLTLDKSARASLRKPHGKKRGPTKTERQIRLRTHCMHVQFLLFHNLVRNGWLCDREVQEILVQQLPPRVSKEVERWRTASGLHVNVQDVTSSRNGATGESERARHGSPRVVRDWSKQAEKVEVGAPNLSRGDPLIRLLKMLSAYWRKRFTITAPGLRKQGYKSLQRLEVELSSFRRDPDKAKNHGERIKDLKEFRDRARTCRGSRDVGAQLFTALLRGLGLEARMVASLQPLGFGWSKSEDAAATRRKGNDDDVSSPAGEESDDGEDGVSADDAESATGVPERDIPKTKKASNGGLARTNTPRKNPGNQAHAAINVPDCSSQPQVIEGSDEDDVSVVQVSPSLASKSRLTHFDKDLAFPIYWTEVLSPITNRYISVDPLVLNIVACTSELVAGFEPRGSKAERSKQVIAYVVGYSADGTAKDVTVRYLKRRMWPGKTKGVRMPVEKVPIYNQKGRIKMHQEVDTFKSIMSGYARDARLRTLADDIEDQNDLEPVRPARQAKGGEETLQGYKSSAEFVLERHLRRDEALKSGSKHIKMFTTGKGEKAVQEKVYLRQDVVTCKTVESWHKEGRQVKPGEQPMKLVPIRAVTLTRKRELEQAEAEGGEKVKQGLYAREQTDWIIPAPIKDGIIPKNAFGNIDCYVPSMVPEGAVHLPYRGMVKVCRRLDINYAEAVVGFDFKSQRAVPLVQGVVIATENKQAVMEAWQADEAERLRKEDKKREMMTLALWRKFLMGLRILVRVNEEYGGDGRDMPDEFNPFTNRNRKKSATQQASSGLGKDAATDFRTSPVNGVARSFTTSEDDRQQISESAGIDSWCDGGGGGFLPEEDNGSDVGILSSANDEDDSTAGAGGFLIEDDADVSGKPKNNLSRWPPETIRSARSQARDLNQVLDGRGSAELSAEETPRKPQHGAVENKRVTSRGKRAGTHHRSNGGIMTSQSTRPGNVRRTPAQESSRFDRSTPSLTDSESSTPTSYSTGDSEEEDEEEEEEEEEAPLRTARKRGARGAHAPARQPRAALPKATERTIKSRFFPQDGDSDTGAGRSGAAVERNERESGVSLRRSKRTSAGKRN